MSNAIERDVYVLRNTLKNPISYVRGTDLLPIIFHFRDFTIPSGATATAFTAKPDGNAVYGSATISENDVTVDVQQQMFIVLGLSMLQVEIKSGEETLATFAQPVMVEPNLKAGDFPPSTTDINFLDEVIEQSQEAVNNANQAIASANTAIEGANTAASSANQAAQNANQAAEDLQDKVDAGDFTASVQVGTTTTLEPGQDATVSNGGTSKDAVLNFGVPKGDPGTTATIQVGTTQTVQPEANAEVTNTGTTSAAVLNFKIPRGEDGMTDLTAEYKDASEYTCQPTVNAPVVVKEVEGKTEQVVTTGAQLFDVESYPFMDGKWISYNIGDVSSDSLYKCTDFIPFSGYDRLTINLNHIPSGSNPGMAFYSSDTQESYISGGKGNAITVPEGTQYMRFTVDASVPDDDVMLNEGSTALPYEPYTGGSPAPSPDYPQVIKGVGGMGYFDGKWRTGVYQITDGQWVAAGNGICSQNPIPAKSGDIATLEYTDPVTLTILAYNSSGGYLGNVRLQNINKASYTLPANTAYIRINVQLEAGTPIDPSTAKYCTVTINGEYQTGVEVMGKNLAEVTQTYKNQASNGVTFKLNDDGSYTLNGTRTGTTIFRLNQPNDADIPNYPVIYKLKAGTKYRITGSQVLVRNSTSPSGTTAYSNAMDNDVFYTPTEDTDVVGIRSLAIQGTTYSSTKTYYPGIWEDPDETLTEWVPFKRTSLTIPLTAPLYEGDKICYVKPGESYVDAEGDTVVADGMLYGCYRENAEVVFDGSEDEAWEIYANERYSGFRIEIEDMKENSYNDGFSNLFPVQKSSINDPGIWLGSTSASAFSNYMQVHNVNPTYATDVNNWKTWLQSHNMTVLYPIATPYFEPFADQSIFYGLRTDDTLSYVYSNDPIEPVLTVEVAKNSTGGYLLESYAQAQKNAISEASSQSRISAIEQQLVNQATTPTE